MHYKCLFELYKVIDWLWYVLSAIYKMILKINLNQLSRKCIKIGNNEQ
jgi:hypothetical protein